MLFFPNDSILVSVSGFENSALWLPKILSHTCYPTLSLQLLCGSNTEHVSCLTYGKKKKNRLRSQGLTCSTARPVFLEVWSVTSYTQTLPPLTPHPLLVKFLDCTQTLIMALR
jgi:hypothetical protein